MILKAFTLLWATVVSIYVGTLMLKHTVPLATPTGLNSLALKVAKNWPGTLKWARVHVIDPKCSCSEKVMDQVIERQSVDFDDLVVVTTLDANDMIIKLAEKNIRYVAVSRDELKSKYSIESVPWLVVLDDTQKVVYSGGYANGPILDTDDVELDSITESVRSKRDVAAKNVFGCVLSDRFSALFNWPAGAVPKNL